MRELLFLIGIPLGIFVLGLIISFLKNLIGFGFDGFNTINKDDVLICAIISLSYLFLCACYLCSSHNYSVRVVSFAIIFIYAISAGIYIGELKSKIDEKDRIIKNLSEELQSTKETLKYFLDKIKE